MSEKKIIAVLGATGAQGGGLAHAILNDSSGEFTCRAITRNPDSDSAKALAAAGAEVVQGDLDDVESLKNAFTGAYGVYGVTNYWEHMDPDREIKQAKHIAEAAKAAGAQHVIWSTFEDTREFVPLISDQMPTLMEKYKVPHFDTKAEANKYFTELELPVTLMYTSFYWDNFIHFGMGPQKGEDGKYGIAMPMGETKLPGIAAEDIGQCAYGIFKGDSEYIGKTVGVAGEHLTGSELAAGIGKSLGIDVHYHPVPADVYRGFGFPGADDLGNMFQFKRDFNDTYTGIRDVAHCRTLHPNLMSFDQWLAKYGDKIPVK